MIISFFLEQIQVDLVQFCSHSDQLSHFALKSHFVQLTHFVPWIRFSLRIASLSPFDLEYENNKSIINYIIKVPVNSILSLVEITAFKPQSKSCKGLNRFFTNEST